MIPLEIRDLIDMMVHTVIHDTYQHFPQGLESRCAIYSIVGAQSLSQLTGIAYEPICGSQSILLACGETHLLSPPAGDIRIASTLQQLRNYHCWIQTAKGDMVEVVDFTLRHSDAACMLLGITPLQSVDDSYAWVTMPAAKVGNAQVHEVFHYASCLQADKKLTQLLHAFQTENSRLFDYLTRKCLGQINTGLLEFETLLKYQARIHDNQHRVANLGQGAQTRADA